MEHQDISESSRTANLKTCAGLDQSDLVCCVLFHSVMSCRVSCMGYMTSQLCLLINWQID